MTEVLRLLRFPTEESSEFWTRSPPRHSRNSWDNIEDPAVLLERHLSGHTLAGPLWDWKFEELLVWKRMAKYQHGNMWMTYKWLGRRRTWTHVENPAERNWLWRFNAIMDQVYFSCTHSEARLIHKRFSSKPSCSKKLTTTREGDEQYQTEGELFVEKEHCVELFCGRSFRKTLWEILRISSERCVFSSAGGNALHECSLNTSGRFWNNWRALWGYLLRLSWNACNWRNGNTSSIMVSKHSGTICNKMEQSLCQKNCWDRTYRN